MFHYVARDHGTSLHLENRGGDDSNKLMKRKKSDIPKASQLSTPLGKDSRVKLDDDAGF